MDREIERALNRSRAALLVAANDLEVANTRETRKSREGWFLVSANECRRAIVKIEEVLKENGIDPELVKY